MSTAASSRARARRIDRVWQIQQRIADAQRSVVVQAQQAVDDDAAQLATVERYIHRLPAVIDRQQEYLAHRAREAKSLREEQLEASTAGLAYEQQCWEREYQRANSLERIVERFDALYRQHHQREQQEELESLALSRRSRTQGGTR